MWSRGWLSLKRLSAFVALSHVLRLWSHMRGIHQNLQLMMFCPCFLLCVGLLPPFFFLFCCCCLFSCVSFFLYLSQSPAFMPVSPSVALEAKRKAQLTCVLCACLSFGWRGKKHEEKGGAEKRRTRKGNREGREKETKKEKKHEHITSVARQRS